MSKIPVSKLFADGVEAHRAGRLDEAIRCYHSVLAREDGHVFALHYLGVALHQQGHPDAALPHLERSIAMHPRNAGFFSNLGNALKDLGRHGDAERAYYVSIEIKPGQVEACFNLGQLQELNGDVTQATILYEQALRTDPRLAPAMERLAVLLSLSDPLRAVEYARAAGTAECAGMAEDRDILFECRVSAAIILYRAGREEEAAAVIEAMPVLEIDINRLVSASRRLVVAELSELAERLLAPALAVYPDSLEIAEAFGNALNALGRGGEALWVLEPFLCEHPKLVAYWETYANACKELGRLDAAMRANDEVLKLSADNLVVRGNQVQIVLCRDDMVPSDALARALDYGRSVGRCLPKRDIPKLPFSRGAKLRIGIVSPDLRFHPVGKFIVNLFRHADRERLDLVGFSDSDSVDPLALEIRGAASDWCNCAGWSNERLAEAIVARRIDVLIDLAGHGGVNRLPMFSWRLAPVQATYLGFAGTTGAPGVDYRIADWTTEPASADAASSEKLIRMEGSYFCYDPCYSAGPPVASPALRRGFMTFGCFVQRIKITPRTLALWRAVLEAVPDARMVVRCRSFVDVAVRDDFCNCLREAGADPRRFDLGPWASAAEHIGLFDEIDIGLNTYPFHQATNLCDAYWAGVPTLSLIGDAHPSRIALSIGQAAGYPELCVVTDEGLVQAARRLASDPQELGRNRKEMRDRVASSALWDGRSFARRFGHAVRSLA